MSCGSWCVYYRDKGEHCKQCSDYQGDKRSSFEFGKLDLKTMAEGLAKKGGDPRLKIIMQKRQSPINYLCVQVARRYRYFTTSVIRKESALTYYRAPQIV